MNTSSDSRSGMLDSDAFVQEISWKKAAQWMPVELDINCVLRTQRGACRPWEDSLTLLIYNHNIPGAGICTEEVSISLAGISPSKPVLMTRIDHDNANPKQKWIELGSPENPTRAQLAEIEKASLPMSQGLIPAITGNGCVLTFSIPPHGILKISI